MLDYYKQIRINEDLDSIYSRGRRMFFENIEFFIAQKVTEINKEHRLSLSFEKVIDEEKVECARLIEIFKTLWKVVKTENIETIKLGKEDNNLEQYLYLMARGLEYFKRIINILLDNYTGSLFQESFVYHLSFYSLHQAYKFLFDDPYQNISFAKAHKIDIKDFNFHEGKVLGLLNFELLKNKESVDNSYNEFLQKENNFDRLRKESINHTKFAKHRNELYQNPSIGSFALTNGISTSSFLGKDVIGFKIVNGHISFEYNQEELIVLQPYIFSDFIADKERDVSSDDERFVNSVISLKDEDSERPRKKLRI